MMARIPLPKSKSLSGLSRHGVTLMEVMFATGIVMIGLLGIASLLPIANRQANDSYIITYASAAGQNWYRVMLARKLHTPSGQPWLIANDTTGILSPTNSMDNIAAVAPADVSPPFGNPPAVQAQRLGFCIDPLFWSGQTTIPVYDPSSAAMAFRPALFPYFTPRFSPLTLPTTNAGLNWNFQPRLLRVTYPSLANLSLPVPQKVVEELFATADDLVTVRDESDNSLNAVLGVSRNSTGSLGKLAAQGNLSWIATLVPMEIDSSLRPDSYTSSIVVFNRRNRNFDIPTTSAEAIDPPDDERVAVVLPSSPGTTLPASPLNQSFSGGNGFDVGIIASEYGKRKIKAGAWIMLSRQFTFPSGNIRHIHKWFRVTSTNSEAKIPSATLMSNYGITGSPSDYWYQDVHLMGPDWIFQLPSSANTLPVESTIATIVPDVVAVYERILQVK